MPRVYLLIAVLLIALAQSLLPSPAEARRLSGMCVKYVRSLTDFEIRGDAWSWWGKAAGLHDRGRRPEVGAVMVFKRRSHLRRGHVAVVSGIVDKRTILVDHSWIAGQGLHRNMRVIDTSLANDWSEVRVWHSPTNTLGLRRYPIYGFIYPRPAGTRAIMVAAPPQKPGTQGQTIAALDAEASTEVAETPYVSRPQSRGRPAPVASRTTIAEVSPRTLVSLAAAKPRSNQEPLTPESIVALVRPKPALEATPVRLIPSTELPIPGRVETAPMMAWVAPRIVQVSANDAMNNRLSHADASAVPGGENMGDTASAEMKEEQAVEPPAMAATEVLVADAMAGDMTAAE